MEGGGGTTFGAPSVGPVEAYAERLPDPPETPVEGGGATTFDPRDEPDPLRDPRGAPPAATFGGGGRTVAGKDGAALADCVPVEFTAGGGGTTSDAPKSLPTMLLKNPDCAGGGGTTDFEGSAALLVERRRMSWLTLADGGGAMTEGAGMVSLAVRDDARSGAEAGGGTTAASVLCRGERVTSRETEGAGAMTLEESDAEERFVSRETLGAGATMDGARE
jgi:hypothetical protein